MDIEADKFVTDDRGEAMTLVEPLIIQNQAKQREELADLALKLTLTLFPILLLRKLKNF